MTPSLRVCALLLPVLLLLLGLAGHLAAAAAAPPPPRTKRNNQVRAGGSSDTSVDFESFFPSAHNNNDNDDDDDDDDDEEEEEEDEDDFDEEDKFSGPLGDDDEDDAYFDGLELRSRTKMGRKADLLVNCTAFTASAVPVYVVEHHNHVLLPYYSAAACGVLPHSSVTVIHFDSHADYLLPERDMPRAFPATERDVHRVIGKTGIGSFYLALWYHRMVEHVVWVRSEFTAGNYNEPAEVGTVRVRIGTDRRTGGFCMTASGFDITDDECSEEPRDAREITLTTAVMSTVMDPAWSVDGPVVLDIDMDFFASDDPLLNKFMFITGLSHEQMRAFHDLVTAINDDLSVCKRRMSDRAKVDGLMRGIVRHHLGGTAVDRKLPERRKLPVATTELFCSGKAFGRRMLKQLAAMVDSWPLADQARRKKMHTVFSAGWQSLLDTLEEDEPWGRHTEQDMVGLARDIGTLIARGSINPSMVTLCRSVRDKYTPRDLWPTIEWSLLASVTESLAMRGKATQVTMEDEIDACPKPDHCIRSNRPSDCFRFHYAKTEV